MVQSFSTLENIDSTDRKKTIGVVFMLCNRQLGKKNRPYPFDFLAAVLARQMFDLQQFCIIITKSYLLRSCGKKQQQSNASGSG